MNHELLAVVDDQDSIVDYQPRHLVHAMGLKHRAVHILVFNDTGLLFLQKRSLTKDINPGLWDTSAAGHVDNNEGYDHCAHREIQEELGIEVTNLEFLLKLTACETTGMEFIHVYRCCHNGPFSLEAGEIDDGQWFEPVTISLRVEQNDTSLTDTFKLIWREFMAHTASNCR